MAPPARPQPAAPARRGRSQPDSAALRRPGDSDRAENPGHAMVEPATTAATTAPREPRPSFRALRAIGAQRSEEHTSELQSLMRISYAVFCLKKKTKSYSYYPPSNYHPTNKTQPKHTNH